MAASNPYRLQGIAGQTGSRISLRQRMKQLDTMPAGFRPAKMAAIRERMKGSKGFRFHAPRTIARQDHHLSMYQYFMGHKYEVDPDQKTPVELDEFLFPESFDKLYEDLEDFLAFVYEETAPRSRILGDKISYSALTHYRDSMMFWVRYKYRLHNRTLPPMDRVRATMTDALRFLVSDDPDTHRIAARGSKVFIGMGELRQLFDYEMENNICIENSEQHQVIWVIARLTACRPGSLCISGKYGRTKPMTWRNLEFMRTDEPGRFNLKIRFDNIHIKGPNDPEAAVARWQDPGLTVILNCPQPQNIVFSAAHRLLAMALRRGLLEDIDSIDALFSHDKHFIRIKESSLDDPLFYACSPKGIELSTRPLTVTACGDYLRTRGRKMGFPGSLQMYGIRRRAATDLTARVGAAGARRLLGHDPESFTLERYYLAMGEIFDATAVGLGERFGQDHNGYSEALIRNFSPLSIGKLSNAQLALTMGASLQALTTKLILADPIPPLDFDAAALKNYRRKQRAYARQALAEQQAYVARTSLTQERFQQHLLESESSAFAKAVLARAIDLSRANEEQEAHIANPDDNDEEPPDIEGHQPDLEETAQAEVDATKSSTLIIQAEAEVGDSEDTTNIAYHLLARSFMETLLDNSLRVVVSWENQEDKTCPLCQDDETILDKGKIYNSRQHLEAHMPAQHTALAKWNRALELRRNEREDKMYACLYCEAVEPDDKVKKYPDASSLRRHIRKSTEQTSGLAHDLLKAEAGWYTADFLELKPTSHTIVKSQRAGKKLLQQEGLVFKARRPILFNREPVPDQPGLVFGSSDHMEIPDRFKEDLKIVKLAEYKPWLGLGRLQGLQRGAVSKTTRVPTWLKDDIIVKKVKDL